MVVGFDFRRDYFHRQDIKSEYQPSILFPLQDQQRQFVVEFLLEVGQ
jgi:hypothetical protein